MNKIPTHKKIPMVSRLVSIRNAARLVKNPIPVVQETMEKMGPTYFFHMGGRNLGLLTRELHIIQHILQKNHKNYHKSRFQTDELASYVGKGLLTNNGEDWLKQRRLIQPAFGRKNIDTLSSIMEEEIHDVFQQEIGNGGRTEISHVSAMLTFHIVTRAIFSDEVSHAQIVELRDRVERVQKMIILQIRQPFKRWYYSLSGMMRKHHRLADEVKDLIRGLIENRQKDGHRKEDILQFLLDTRYEDTGQPMSTDRLVDELLIMMVAGHETTAHSLTWTLYLLNQHPDVSEAAMGEVVNKGNTYMEYFAPDSRIMSIIKESLRMYPPAWVIDRTALQDDIIDGYRIPKNITIMQFIYGLHHDEKYWDAPHEFRPDRFIKNPKPDAYFPFGAGPRLCIGNHFAYLELIITLVKFLQSYRLPKKAIPYPGIKPLITLQPEKAVWMDLERK